VDVNILGPIEVRGHEGREIRLPAGRERSLFVLLLIHRGEVVSTDRIIDVLWGSQPPGAAMKAIQGYVSHLRRVLEPGGANSLLVTQSPGYALRSGAIVVDATRFEQLAGDGRRALEAGSAEEAARVLDGALALWRGPALAEFAFDDFARNEIDRLEQLRLGATEDRIDALLRLGRHGELAGRLDSLVAAHPLRERLRGQWMLALYRSGRQADALQAYRDGRRLLASELGLDPGPELQRIERAILEQDPALEVSTPAPPPAVAREPEKQDPPQARAAIGRRRVVVGGALVAIAPAAWILDRVLADDTPAAVKVAPPAVVAVDAKTNRVVASITAGSAPSVLAADEGGIWVGDARDGTVTRVDPSTRRVVHTIGIDAPAIDMATGLGSVWVATGSFGSILRIDPQIDRRVDGFDLAPGDPIVPTASAVAVANGRLWAGAFSGLVRIDPRSGAIVQHVDLGQAPALRIATGNGYLWATLITQRITRVVEGSGKRAGEFHVGKPVLPIAVGKATVWVAGLATGGLWEIDAGTLSPVSQWPTGHGALAIALGAGALWMASWSDGALLRVDPSSGRVVKSIPLGGFPGDVLVRDGLVWVAVAPERAA
jgi:DNA-binding SARP family transcriptional activator/DNA-binding beta-propeller fold protein YncE